jgi:pimeloyl-ACP methyl ester carboxylesterase
MATKKPMLLLLCVFSFFLIRYAGAQDTIIGEEHRVSSISAADGKLLKIFLWEKRLKDAEVKEFAATGKVILLAHGAGSPGHIVFDLQVPGKPDLTYSLMDYLAERKYDVFAIDYQNYGLSDQHECGLCVTTQVAANDLSATVDYICNLRGVKHVYLLGWSWGTIVGGLFTMERPHKVKRLILYGPPVYKGPSGTPPTNQFRPITKEAIKGIFESQATDDIMLAAFLKEALKFPKAPNGVIFDLSSKMPIVFPRQITVPTMIIMGSLDRATPITQPDLPGFFAELANPDKQFIIVPGGGHCLLLQKPRLRFFTEVYKWFSLE